MIIRITLYQDFCAWNGPPQLSAVCIKFVVIDIWVMMYFTVIHEWRLRCSGFDEYCTHWEKKKHFVFIPPFIILILFYSPPQFGLMETVMTCIQDEFPKMRRYKSHMAVLLGAGCFLLALPCTCPVGG